MRKRIIISVAACLALLVPVFIVIGDTRHTNLRYLMWKWGWTDYSQDVCIGLFRADSSFKQSLRGLSKKDIQKWFPDLRHETKPERYLDRNQLYFISSPDFLWIGVTQLVIEFEDGKVTGFTESKNASHLEDRQAFFEGASSGGLSS